MELFILGLSLIAAWVFGIVCESIARDFCGKSLWNEHYKK